MSLLTKKNPNAVLQRHYQQETDLMLPASTQQISLMDLAVIGYRFKGLIFAIATATTLMAVGITFLTKKIFRAEAFILPPRIVDIQELIVPGFEKKAKDREIDAGPNSTTVYEEFQRTIKSRETLREYFLKEIENSRNVEQAPPADPLLQAKIEAFARKVQISETAVSVEDEDPENAAKWANGLVQYANNSAVKKVGSETRLQIASRIASLSENILQAKRTAYSDRQAAIIRLQDAAKLAEKLGIKQNKIFYQSNTGMSTIYHESGRGSRAGMEISAPLYLEGTLGLNATIELLKSRENDDPYIYGLGEKKEQLAWLKSVVIKDEAIRTVTIDQSAYAPHVPIGPNRQLYLVFGLGIGILAGVLAASVIYMWQTLREAESGPGKFSSLDEG